MQFVAIGRHVLDGAKCHAAVGGSLRYGRCNLDHQARIKRLGNQIFRAKSQLLTRIGCRHHFALLCLRQLGNGVYSRNFHFDRDGRGTRIQRTAEDVRKAQHVVHLVRIVGTARGHDGIVTYLLDFLRKNFWRGVCQCKDQRFGGHFGHHVFLQHASGGEAQKNVRAINDFTQRTGRCLLRKHDLVGIHQLGATFIDHASQVRHKNVFTRQAQFHQQAQAGQCCSTRPRGHQLDGFDVFAHHLDTVQDGRTHANGGAVLVIMEDRDLHALAQLALHIKAVWRLDVFQVDAAKRRLQRGNDVHQLVEVVFFADLDVKHINASKFLEQNALAFHHRLGGQRADVAQAQHGGAVGDYCHQVAPGRVLECVVRVFDNFLARRGDTGRIGQRQVMLVDQLLGRGNGNLAGRRELVVFERGTAQLGAFFFGVGRCLGHCCLLLL